MKILVKYPTRSRPQQFLKTLNEYYNRASDNSNIEYVISYDLDDKTMTHSVLERALLGPNVKLCAGHSQNKIHACNRDIKKPYKWDILLLISDDMFCETDGWDKIIRNKMKEHFPDTDGCLWFYDGYQERICTLSCMGKKYYQLFNYIYHPDYTSLWCDNEFTEVAQKLNKMVYIKDPIIKHAHPCWGKKMQMDELYRHNESFFQRDFNVYQKRKNLNFYDKTNNWHSDSSGKGAKPRSPKGRNKSTDKSI